MKKRFTIAFAALLVFGLAIVAFAYTKANNSAQTSAVNLPDAGKASRVENC
jgi:cbb3-type cytochrome oxidase subunit 3